MRNIFILIFFVLSAPVMAQMGGGGIEYDYWYYDGLSLKSIVSKIEPDSITLGGVTHGAWPGGGGGADSSATWTAGEFLSLEGYGGTYFGPSGGFWASDTIGSIGTTLNIDFLQYDSTSMEVFALVQGVGVYSAVWDGSSWGPLSQKITDTGIDSSDYMCVGGDADTTVVMIFDYGGSATSTIHEHERTSTGWRDSSSVLTICGGMYTNNKISVATSSDGNIYMLYDLPTHDYTVLSLRDSFGIWNTLDDSLSMVGTLLNDAMVIGSSGKVGVYRGAGVHQVAIYDPTSSSWSSVNITTFYTSSGSNRGGIPTIHDDVMGICGWNTPGPTVVVEVDLQAGVLSWSNSGLTRPSGDYLIIAYEASGSQYYVSTSDNPTAADLQTFTSSTENLVDGWIEYTGATRILVDNTDGSFMSIGVQGSNLVSSSFQTDPGHNTGSPTGAMKIFTNFKNNAGDMLFDVAGNIYFSADSGHVDFGGSDLDSIGTLDADTVTASVFTSPTATSYLSMDGDTLIFTSTTVGDSDMVFKFDEDGYPHTFRMDDGTGRWHFDNHVQSDGNFYGAEFRSAWSFATAYGAFPIIHSNPINATDLLVDVNSTGQGTFTVGVVGDNDLYVNECSLSVFHGVMQSDTLQVDAVFASVKEVSAATYTALCSDYMILLTDTCAVTFPLLSVAYDSVAAVRGYGLILFVKAENIGDCTVDANGSETIDGSTSVLTLSPWDCFQIQATNRGWRIL